MFNHLLFELFDYTNIWKQKTTIHFKCNKWKRIYFKTEYIIKRN